eukprot:TRINITY_DN103088_c0_g1_i1.p1 TRINITY_DN103088_c0_g1~~TRINITY_DN103088_c0_g1_i1.p1  ORF type:complete len:691 (+),score=183.14 TRINITY_DN103088_c0_g1_i1:71-2143(+)
MSLNSSVILQNAARDIDRFLDPSVHSLAQQETAERGQCSLKGELRADIRADKVARLRREDSGDSKSVSAVSESNTPWELHKLRCANEGLRAELEDTREELQALMAGKEREAGRHASVATRLTQERDDFQHDGRAKKRRLSELEDELLQVRSERDSLAERLDELEEKAAQAQREADLLQSQAATDRRRHEEDMAALRRSLQAQAGERGASEGDTKVLKARISELESETSTLRLALQQGAPERALSEQLRARHTELQGELRQARKASEELRSTRELALQLEHENASLKAALDVRDRALMEAEEAGRGAQTSSQDLRDFVAVASEVLAAAAGTAAAGPSDGQQEAQANARQPSPLDLRLAWSRLQSDRNRQRLQAAEAAQKLEEVGASEREAQAEIRQLKIELANGASQLEELGLDLRSAKEGHAALSAREAVLREALAGRGDASAALKGLAKKDEEGASTQRVQELEKLLAAKRETLELAAKDAEEARQELKRLADVDARARRLERMNEQLFQANKELESRALELERQQDEAAMEDADYDRRTTKILHLAKGPGGRGLLGEEPAVARASGDLEQQQAAKHLERFKKATKKYLQEFREGIYCLLGWRIEMKGEGSQMRFHLMSRYDKAGQELVFQLRPASLGHNAEFDLLGTPWAVQLQGNREAMAYLEMFSSIPGFLAYVTNDLVTKQTIDH